MFPPALYGSADLPLRREDRCLTAAGVPQACRGSADLKNGCLAFFL